MKLFITFVASTLAIFLSAFKSISVGPAELVGTWGFGSPESRTVMINTDKIFSVATYNLPGKKFISSYGGAWRIENNKLIKKIEWNSADSTQVGKEIVEEVEITGGKLITKNKKESWNRLGRRHLYHS